MPKRQSKTLMTVEANPHALAGPGVRRTTQKASEPSTQTSTSEHHPGDELVDRYKGINEENRQRSKWRPLTDVERASAALKLGKTTSPEIASIAGKYVNLSEHEIIALMLGGHAAEVAKDLQSLAGSALVQS